MGKSTSTSNSILALIYNAVAWANIADNAGSSPRTYIEIALHTGTVAVGDAQTVNEANFGAYARLQIARSTSGFEVPASGSTSNKTLAQFLECTGGTNVITNVSTGHGGTVLHTGTLSSPRTISSGIRAQFGANQLVVSES